jgi:hypothetical protein
MKGGRRARRQRLLAEIATALIERQLELRIVEDDPHLIVEGTFVLSSAQGPFDQYQVRIVVSGGFPIVEPKVAETGGRIPRNETRHINVDGTCCLGVWEEWLVNAPDNSFGSFLSGPVHDFFLSQWWFENKGHWRLGERGHGLAGLLESYAELLRVPIKRELIVYYLRLLSQEWPRGHWPCPCGSGQIIRKCHRSELFKLHQRVSPNIARRMLRRLKSAIALEQPRAGRLNLVKAAA